MAIADRIERTILLPVPRKRVWDAVTKPEQFARWFGVVGDMDFRVGGAIQFIWENERCPYPGVIEVIEPEQRFVFRWPSYAVSHPNVTYEAVPSTVVEITLEERAEGTFVTLVESGFASLPQPIPVEDAFRDNQDGWQECLIGLRDYLQSQEVA